MINGNRTAFLYLPLYFIVGTLLWPVVVQAHGFRSAWQKMQLPSGDTVPAIKLNTLVPKNQPVPQKEISFVKNFLSAFSFKKNADANERLRVKAILNSLRTDTNTIITNHNLLLLKHAMDSSNWYLLNYLQRETDSLHKQVQKQALLRDSLSAVFKSIHLQYRNDSIWIERYRRSLADSVYMIGRQLDRWNAQSGPDTNIKEIEGTIMQLLKSVEYIQDLKKNLAESNIYFYPRPPQKSSDPLFLTGTNTRLDAAAKRSRYFFLYSYVVNNPCASCFMTNTDKQELATSRKYMSELGIDSLIKAENISRLSHNRNPYYSRYQFIVYKLTGLLGKITLAVLSLLLILGTFYHFMTKYRGDGWKAKKPLGFLLVVIIYFFMLSLISYLYCADALPYVGIKAMKTNPAFLLDSISITSSSTTAATKDDAAFNLSQKCDCCNITLPEVLFYTTLLFLIVALFIIPRVIMAINRKNSLIKEPKEEEGK